MAARSNLRSHGGGSLPGLAHVRRASPKTWRQTHVLGVVDRSQLELYVPGGMPFCQLPCCQLIKLGTWEKTCAGYWPKHSAAISKNSGPSESRTSSRFLRGSRAHPELPGCKCGSAADPLFDALRQRLYRAPYAQNGAWDT